MLEAGTIPSESSSITTALEPPLVRAGRATLTVMPLSKRTESGGIASGGFWAAAGDVVAAEAKRRAVRYLLIEPVKTLVFVDTTR